jgi:hypothetical protein
MVELNAPKACSSAWPLKESGAVDGSFTLIACRT